MKTYKIKNYKGNLVESLSRFQNSHKDMKIVEACEDGTDLKIKADIQEAAGKKVYLVLADMQDGNDLLIGIASNKAEAKSLIEDATNDPSECRIEEIEIDYPASKTITLSIDEV